LDHIDALDAAIAGIDQEVDSNGEPFREAIERLSKIPGLVIIRPECWYRRSALI
jgi:hypothetical protein